MDIQDKFQLLLALLLLISTMKHLFKVPNYDFNLIKLVIQYMLSESKVLEEINSDFKAMLIQVLFSSFYYNINTDNEILSFSYDFSLDMVNFGLSRITFFCNRSVSKNFENI